jgi:hypothetical protein
MSVSIATCSDTSLLTLHPSLDQCQRMPRRAVRPLKATDWETSPGRPDHEIRWGFHPRREGLHPLGHTSSS